MIVKREIKYEIIINEVKTYSKINAEEFVINLFKNLGFDCERSSKRFGYEVGLPDLFISKGGEEYFVEVKTNGDGLKMAQAEWILNNLEKKVIVFYLKQKILEKQMKKISKERENIKQEFEELKEIAEEAAVII